ncbi:Bone morphogenetic protein 2, partial [Calypte anna]
AEALKRLLEVFGMEDPPPPPAHSKQPPQYMVDLFNTVANADGVTKNPDVLEGNTVRSFLDKSKGRGRGTRVAGRGRDKWKLTAPSSPIFCVPGAYVWVPVVTNICCCPQVSVYQVLKGGDLDAPGGKKLLAARLVALQGSGWEVFSITQAVRDWTEDESSNQGLLVTVQGLGGSLVENPPLQFASGRDHHESKKPMLVLFTDDGRRGASLPMGDFPADFQPQAPLLPSTLPVPKRAGPRSTRSLDQLQPCQRHPLSVDFEEIGWSGWIISPRGYNAYHCKGSCPFPLGENMRPTNHATVQSIINALKLSEGVSSPCCVPNKLYSINLLYFDDDENVVLKQYDDMVAGSCGCH